MSQYKIERWDVVMFGNSVTKVPMIYIKPDLTFLDFARINNFAVSCEINGSGTIYDGKEIPGVVDKSCFVPNCRPNFCEKTGFYVITLWANWYGYPEPDKMGMVKFSGMKSPIEDSYKHYGPVPMNAPPAPYKVTSKSTNSGLSTVQILVLVGVLLVAVFSSLYLYKLFIKK
jgi:hypothetical protein